MYFRAVDPCSADQNTLNLDELNFVIGNTLIHEIDLLAWIYPDSKFQVKNIEPKSNSGSYVVLEITHPNGQKTMTYMENCKLGAEHG